MGLGISRKYKYCHNRQGFFLQLRSISLRQLFEYIVCLDAALMLFNVLMNESNDVRFRLRLRLWFVLCGRVVVGIVLLFFPLLSRLFLF